MFKHLFKLMWNRKRKNLLLTIEIFVSFIVLFIICCFLIFAYDNYSKPLGFDPNNIKVVQIHLGSENKIFSDSLANYHDAIKQMLDGFPEIKGYTFSDFAIPYVMGSHTSLIKYKKHSEAIDNYFKDDNTAKVLGFQLLEGRWFDKRDDDTSKNTVVITESFKKKFFENEDPIGKQLYGVWDDKQKWDIVGVIADTKSKSDYLPPTDGIYLRFNQKLKKTASTILLKVNPEAGADFDSRLNKALSSTVKSANIDISSLNDSRTTKNKIVLIPAIIFITICGFLILNVCMGLFGVLWYNINKRKSEIGLRKAVGASSMNILFHFVGEAWSLATLAVFAGLFFAIQFPLLRVLDIEPIIYIKGILFSTIFIYFIVFLCALYPSRQASKVFPALVLHEE